MESILDAIGNKPLVRLRACAPPNGAELWIKLEYYNPSGSVKDPMALAMIEGAERDGQLSPGDTVVEYTRGGARGRRLRRDLHGGQRRRRQPARRAPRARCGDRHARRRYGFKYGSVSPVADL